MQNFPRFFQTSGTELAVASRWWEIFWQSKENQILFRCERTKLRFVISDDWKISPNSFNNSSSLSPAKLLMRSFSFYHKFNRNANNFAKFCHYSCSISVKIFGGNIFFLCLAVFIPKFLFWFQKVLQNYLTCGTVSISRKNTFSIGIFLSFWLVLVFCFYGWKLLNLLLLFYSEN